MPTPSTDQLIAGLVYPGNVWSAPALTFSVPRQGSAWTGYPAGGIAELPHAPLNTEQAGNFRTAVAEWARLIGRPLVETDDVSNPGMIRVSLGDTGIHAALAFPPPIVGGQSFSTEPNGDVWLSQTVYGGASLAPGKGTGYFTLLHEIGHALGLKHPHEGEQTLPFEWTNNRYTVMGYDSVPDVTIFSFSQNPSLPGVLDRSIAIAYQTTPMVFDILAIQSRYGANAETNAGATTYRWPSFKPYIEALYDASGVDTFDLSGHTLPSIIDLTPGAYSSIDYWSVEAQVAHWIGRFPTVAPGQIRDSFANAAAVYTGRDNVGIAYGTVIENVIAGSGNDTLTGNAAANVLDGGAGDDRIFGAVGNDTIQGSDGSNYLRGDEGDDSVVGGSGFDDINGNMGNDTASGGLGDDWVVGGKDDDTLAGDTGNDLVYGNLGNDTCDGGDGNDIIRGGQGNDVARGGAGDDYVSGDRGDDTLTGGAGADDFHSFGEAGIDRVTDFSLAQGDRVMLDPGTQYTVAQVGADTVISMTGGGQMILVGVQMSTLTEAWIFGA